MTKSNLAYNIEQAVTNGLGYEPIGEIIEDLDTHLFLMNRTVISRETFARYNGGVTCVSIKPTNFDYLPLGQGLGPEPILSSLENITSEAAEDSKKAFENLQKYSQ